MLGNWIKQTSTTTGTGALTLSAVTGFPGFASQFAVNERFAYAIIDDSTGGPIERGIGYIDGSGNLARAVPMATFSAGTYVGANPSAVSLSAGTKRVVCVEGAQSYLASAPAVFGATYKGYGDLFVSASAGSTTMTADRVYIVPFAAGVDSDIDAIIFRVITAGAAGKMAKVAIYSIGSDGLPGVKLAESSSIAIDTGGVKEATFTRFRPPARFFACWLTDGAPVMQTVGPPFESKYASGFDSSLIPIAYQHHVGATGLAFPSTWTPVNNLVGVQKPQLVARCV